MNSYTKIIINVLQGNLFNLKCLQKALKLAFKLRITTAWGLKKILILIFTTHWNIQYVHSLFYVIICDHSSFKCLITILKFRKDTLKKCYSLYRNVEFTGKFVFRSRFGWSHLAKWSSFMQEKSHIELRRWFRNLISN